MKHYLTTGNFTTAELQQIIASAIAMKASDKYADMSGKILISLFANPSLRTRLSFESGMKKMGGMVNTLNTGNSFNLEFGNGVIMNTDKAEHIKEAAQVVSRYADIISLRKSELITTSDKTANITQSWEELSQDNAINQLAEFATKPVINMESNMYHPCQSLADMMTMQEHIGEVKKKKYVLTWAPHPKALPLATPHSQTLTPCMFGMNVTVVHPEGFDLDSSVVELAKQKATQAGGTLNISHDQTAAFKDADVIMAKSWASLKYFGQWQQEAAHRKQFEDWTVTSEKMAQTNDAKFMHCLPVRRNVVVADSVIDSPNAITIDQAENRMWVQMGIVEFLMNQ